MMTFSYNVILRAKVYVVISDQVSSTKGKLNKVTKINVNIKINPKPQAIL